VRAADGCWSAGLSGDLSPASPRPDPRLTTPRATAAGPGVCSNLLWAPRVAPPRRCASPAVGGPAVGLRSPRSSRCGTGARCRAPSTPPDGVQGVAGQRGAARFGPMVRALLDGFLGAPRSLSWPLRGAAATLVLPCLVVPAGGSPLNRVEGLAPPPGTGWAVRPWSPHLLARTGAPVGHMRPDARAFARVPRRPGRRSPAAGGAPRRHLPSGRRAMTERGRAGMRRRRPPLVVIVAVGRSCDRTAPRRTPAFSPEPGARGHHRRRGRGGAVLPVRSDGGVDRVADAGQRLEASHSAAAASAVRARPLGRATRGRP